ncbi:uncharacterized protein LOC128998874 [Macrosteles quadrilineatus]|uniref:uncharacterized protein LOC128998874 n=1 Tax=Macrosteles quadrilineatus TaxID=74068 RepID=UPI0023E1C634|nr:uncharacterized protein LOC128998874 [Macrosteles quadrilineatus]
MRNIGWTEIWISTLLFYAVSALIPSMKQGFNDKFTSTRQQLTNSIYQNSRDQNNIKINMSTLWSEPLAIQRKMNNVPTIIRTSKHTIMLDHLELWVFQEEKFEYKTTLESLSDYKVQFVKGFDWHDRLFLLVCFQNSVCNLYSATSNFDVTYHQPISDNGDPTDAQFFVQQEKLFLAILFHERSVSVRLNRISSQLRIYQWQNFYMDMELIPDITPTATCIALFKYEEDIVFVLGCPENDAIRFPSQVWSRKPNGEISLVQYLPTDKPTSIKHFMERGENFIFILENDRDENSIYWWEGSEFVRWLSVEGMEKYFQVAVSSNLKYPTFLTFTHKNVLRICLMTSVKLEKIYETIFSSGYITENVSILSVTAFEENDKSYMLVLSKSESQLYISLHHVNVQIMITSASEFPHSEELRSDSIQEALETIQKGVTSLKFKMENLESLSSSVLLTNKDASISHGVVTEEIQVDSGEIHMEVHLRRDIAQFMADLSTNYVEPLSQEVNTTWRKLQTTPMEKNRSLIFQGDVYIKEAKLNSLSAQLINNNVFEPRSFLSAMNPISQRLKNVKAKKLKVEWLVVKKLGNKNVEEALKARTVSGMQAKL